MDGLINPFRYRGYYYDNETKWYYLNSRYYNPEWGRFLNADGIIGANRDLLSYNLYAYCSNNPVVFCDLNGTSVGLTIPWAVPALKAIADALISIATVTFKAVTIAAGVAVASDVINKSSNSANHTTDQTVIYRKGSSTNQNLTPRLTDTDGLSFTTIKPDGKYTVTTVEAINDTQLLMVYRDLKKPTHYLVIPRNRFLLHQWQLSRENANENPHFLTITLKSVLWDSNGNYCGLEEGNDE